MAQKKISLRDRAIVKSRLARGLSFSDAMKGTDIASKGSIAKIAKEEVNDIEQLRKEYIAMIRGFGGDDEKKARVLADMLDATRLFGKKAVEHPDWKARLEAVEYIDRLSGLLVENGGAAVNIFNSPEFIKQYDERYK